VWRLESADLLVVRTVGRSKLLRANEGSPYFRPLAQLALMSFGPPPVVGEEFGGLPGVGRVLIYGSWAARYADESGPAPRDVDVLVGWPCSPCMRSSLWRRRIFLSSSRADRFLSGQGRHTDVHLMVRFVASRAGRGQRLGRRAGHNRS
jgi:hypothetical protein